MEFVFDELVLCEVEKYIQEIIINVVEYQTISIKSKEFEGTFGEEKVQQDVNDIVIYAGNLEVLRMMMKDKGITTK